MTFLQMIFYVFAAILVVSSLLVVTVRNPVRAALFLVLAFFSAACLWLTLEAEFLAIGAGARTWLVEAAAAGTSRIGQKMAEAVTLAKLAGTDQVDRALGVAAVHQRFAHGDLASLLTAAGHRTGMHTATEERSLTQGTAGWAGLGTSNTEGAAR